MSDVESRIVTMKFLNGDFKRGVTETIGMLDKLKGSFGFGAAKQNVADLNSEVGRFNVSPMTKGVEGVSKSFVALSTIAISAIATITSRAVSAGITIAKSLSVDQVTAGFAEYELKLGSIQTIMASSGASLETVNQKLAELNAYSDKTIYSFADMTTNIGKFTNAGVSLDDSVAAIQGVANVAAVSGANSEEASRAMYNFAQALSKGHVQLMDWKSIELANMGTVEFKQQLIDAAEATGSLVKQGDKWVTTAGTTVTATQGFNESLTDQWLTTEVLTKTLGNYADETTDIGKKAFAAAQDVKTFSQLMATIKESIGSGWAQTFEILIGNFDEAKELWGGINNAVSTFVGNSADARNSMLQSWKDLGGRTDLIEGFEAAFFAVGQVLSTVKNAFREVFPAMTGERLAELTKRFREFAEGMKPSAEFLERLGDRFKAFFSTLKSFNIGANVISILTGLKNAFSAIFAVIGSVGDAFREVFPPSSTQALADGLRSLTLNFVKFTEKLYPSAEQLENIKRVFVGLFSVIKFIGTTIGSAIVFIKDLFFAIKDGLDINIGFLDWLGNLGDALKNFVGTGDGLKTFSGTTETVQTSLERLRATLGRMINAVKPVIDWFKQLGSTVITNVKEAFSNIDWDLVFSGVTAGSLAGIALAIRKFLKEGLNIDFGGGFLSQAKELLGGFSGVLQGMQENLKANALIKIAGAIGILALALLLLSTIDPARLASAMAGVAGAMTTLMTAMGVMSKFMTTDVYTKLPALAITMLLLAASILILSFAIKKLSDLEWEELGKGLAGVAGGLTVLVLATKPLVANSKGMIAAGLGIIFLSAGLVIMAGAIKVMASLDWGELVRGIAGMAAALGVIAGTMKLMPKNLASTGAGLILLAGGLLIMALAIKVFGTMDIGEIGQGLITIAASLLVVAGAMQLMPPNMLTTAAGLVLVGVAIGLIAGALQVFGNMSIGEIAKSLITLALSLVILGVALTAMSGTLLGAFALIIAAGAIALLIPPLTALGMMTWGEILKGLVGLAAALTLIGIAAAIFGLAAPLLLVGGAALLVFGVGLAAVAVAAYLFASALAIAVKAASEGSEAIRDVLNAVIEFIPKAIAAFAQGIVDFVMTIAEAAPEFVEAFGKIISNFLDILIENIPKIDKVFRMLLDAGINGAREYIPKFVQLGLDLLSGLLSGLIERAPELVRKVGDLVVEMIKAMNSQVGRIVTVGVDLMVNLIKGISQQSVRLTNAAFQAIVDFINGLADGVDRYLPQIKAAAVRLANAIISGLFGGLTAGVQKVIDAARQIAEGAINTIKSIFGIRSPSKVMQEVGKFTSQGLAIGLEKNADEVAKSSAVVGATALRSLKASIRGAGDIITNEMDTSPKITPVLDLTQVKKDASSIARTIGAQQIQANAAIAYASNISEQRAQALQEAATVPQTKNVEFTQIINSPEPLTTIDIYRNTKSQLALAREDL